LRTSSGDALRDVAIKTRVFRTYQLILGLRRRQALGYAPLGDNVVMNTVSEKGMRGLLRRPTIYIVALLGAAWGYLVFCHPEFMLKARDPGGWDLLWGTTTVPTELRCIATIALGMLTTLLPFLVVALVLQRLRASRAVRQ
jgi:hypothetical protein